MLKIVGVGVGGGEARRRSVWWVKKSRARCVALWDAWWVGSPVGDARLGRG